MKYIFISMATFILVCSPATSLALDKIDIYLSGYVQRSIPSESHESMMSNGRPVQQLTIGGGLGGGLKVGLYPDFTNRVIGIELEYGGFDGDLSFQQAGSVRTSNADLVILYSMVNLIVRYPHKKVRPYIGIGAGSVSGLLRNAQIPERKDKALESAIAFGHQFFTGMQVNVHENVFLFGEYKYLSANFHWKQLSVDFRSQHVIGGIGVFF